MTDGRREVQDSGSRTDERIHVLGLTNMRVREMQAPFQAMGDLGTLVTVDADAGVPGYLSALRDGARHIRRRDSDAILAYNGSGLLGVVAVLLSYYYDIPLLIRLNGDIRRQHDEKATEHYRKRDWASLGTHWVFASLTRIAFRLADGFVPVSKTLEEIVREQTGCSPERVQAVPNPLDLDKYDVSNADPDLDREADGDLILTVTNLDFRGKYEGVVETIDALVPTLRRRPELEYVIAGDGRYSDHLQRYLDERFDDASVRNRIHFLGFVDDVVRLYAAADVFIYVSYIDGYPNVIMEAQAAGLPVVANPRYGIEEQIDDGVSGIFVRPDDEGSVTRTVSTLLDDHEMRIRLGRNARRRVEVENDPAVIGRQLYDTVRRMTNPRVDEPSVEVVNEEGRPAKGQKDDIR